MTRRAGYIALFLVACIAAGIAAYIFWPSPALPVAQPAPPIPEAAAAPEPSAPQPTPAPEPDLVLELFEPTPESLNAQQSASRLRNQLEQALVATFLLTRCNYLSQQEYSDTYNSFIRYAVESGLSPDYHSAATELRRIASSAGASYSLVYSRLSCDDASLPPAAASVRAWRDQSARTVSDSSSTP